MAKKNRNDLISDAHEHANNNINPYYWFNRIDNFRLAEWRASWALGPIELVVYSLAIIFATAVAISEKQSKIFILVAILGVFWLHAFIRTIRYIAFKNSNFPVPKPKEKKERLPKRPKNYGRN